MSAFHTVEELRGDRIRHSSGDGMFAATLGFAFDDPERAWLKTEVADLGRKMELWRVLSSGHEIRLREPNKISYLIPTKGRLDVTTRGNAYSAESGGALMFSPNERNTHVSPMFHRHYEALVVLLPAESIGQLMPGSKALLRDFEMPLAGSSEKDASLRAYVTFLASELSKPEALMAQPRLLSGATTLLEDLFVSLFEPDDSTDAKRQSAGADHVRHAEEMMRGRFDEAITMADLANSLNLSPRSLQLAFRQHRGVAPREMLNRIRLEEARKRLLKADAGQSVSSIAFDCGFTHLGRFSIAYRKAYGERPSETLR